MESFITGINVRESDVAVPHFQDETFERNSSGVVISDLEGNLQFVNPTFASLHGYDEKALRGKHLSLFHTQEQMSLEVTPLLEKAKAYGHHQGTVGHVKKDGSTFSTRMSSSILRNDRDVPVGLIVLIDEACNHLKIAGPRQKRRRPSYAAPTTRKIAHDFNNFLNVIIGNIDLTISCVPEHSQIRSNLEEVLVAGTRAQDLVQEILTTTRGDNPGPKLSQVPLLVKETLRLLRPLLPDSIELIEDICTGNGSVSADPVQIQRIIMNLCSNGHHAMEQTGGKLSVTVTEIDIYPGDSSRLNIDPGAYVCLSVSDTGHGIERDVIDKIFDPSYTTKEKGNGLGLFIVREIVINYGGDIKVYSKPGKGTAMEVYLPRIDYDTYRFKNAFVERQTASLCSPKISSNIEEV